MEEAVDFVVVGVGGIGSATLYWLARNAPNAKILGLEQFQLGHLRGGSQDYSRIIRKMYDTPVMTNFARHVYEPWEEVEKESGLQIAYKTGGLFWTSEDTGHMDEVKDWERHMSSAGSKAQLLQGPEIRRRWPQFQFDNEVLGVVDPEGGLVDPMMGNGVHQQCAIARGVRVLSHTRVLRLEKKPGGGMRIETSRGNFSCKKVIVTSGAWVNEVLESCGARIPVKVSQENVTYFATPHLKQFTKENFPIMIYEGKRHDIYALPIHGLPGFKIGFDAAGNEVTGSTRNFTPDPAREELLRQFLRRFIPKALGEVLETRTCLYTMTYDRTFVVDTLAVKGHSDVIVCCGAGHAYKFAALLGRTLSEMAIFGRSAVDISGFRFDRPGITDPTYKPHFFPGDKPKPSKL